MVTSFFQQSFIYTSFSSCRSNVETSMKKFSQYSLIKEMNCVFEENFPIVSSDGPRTAIKCVYLNITGTYHLWNNLQKLLKIQKMNWA